MSSIELWSAVLGWSALINLGVLLYWWLFFVFGHDFVQRLHGRWFALSTERFDAIHYAGMAAYKLANLLFFITPWLALRIAL